MKPGSTRQLSSGNFHNIGEKTAKCLTLLILTRKNIALHGFLACLVISANWSCLLCAVCPRDRRVISEEEFDVEEVFDEHRA